MRWPCPRPLRRPELLRLRPPRSRPVANNIFPAAGSSGAVFPARHKPARCRPPRWRRCAPGDPWPRERRPDSTRWQGSSPTTAWYPRRRPRAARRRRSGPRSVRRCHRRRGRPSARRPPRTGRGMPTTPSRWHPSPVPAFPSWNNPATVRRRSGAGPARSSRSGRATAPWQVPCPRSSTPAADDPRPRGFPAGHPHPSRPRTTPARPAPPSSTAPHRGEPWPALSIHSRAVWTQP